LSGHLKKPRGWFESPWTSNPKDALNWSIACSQPFPTASCGTSIRAPKLLSESAKNWNRLNPLWTQQN